FRKARATGSKARASTKNVVVMSQPWALHAYSLIKRYRGSYSGSRKGSTAPTITSYAAQANKSHFRAGENFPLRFSADATSGPEGLWPRHPPNSQPINDPRMSPTAAPIGAAINRMFDFGHFSAASLAT